MYDANIIGLWNDHSNNPNDTTIRNILADALEDVGDAVTANNLRIGEYDQVIISAYDVGDDRIVYWMGRWGMNKCMATKFRRMHVNNQMVNYVISLWEGDEPLQMVDVEKT